ncbi:MAG TPA: asparaginase domain-containing protein [Aquabacterium sp.]|nr:asparaginase domain-containing protein [Aquabacterium sp.]HRH27646.1 asparaginase domain-containing protein [Aquabacterium sp.]
MGIDSGVVVVLGTGGTIAGTSGTGRDRDYQAAQLSVAQLVAALPELAAHRLEAQQVAQVDSKDMGWSVWRPLLQACLVALARPEVAGLVITHGTDTLEETALLLHLLLPPGKPVVLTAAMRPATSAQADGPGNLLHAVCTVQAAAAQGVHGVVVAMAGRLWPALVVRKAHAWQVDAFDGGGAGPLSGGVQAPGGGAAWPPAMAWCTEQVLACDELPWVMLLTSHADADARAVDALAALPQPPQGWVVACTGHGTVHQALGVVLTAIAADTGALVWRSTRVARGGVAPKDQVGPPDALPVTGALTPAQARLLMSLGLVMGRSAAEQLRQQLLAHPLMQGLLA